MSPELVTTIARMRERACEARRKGLTVGCVPTMGALHDGHGALIERARSESDLVIVTIFVNPIQFDQPQDYASYARTLDADLAYCAARNVPVVFAPSAEEMYPEPSLTFVEVPELTRHLCGAFRPGHFRGVATVVLKLFNVIQPDIACFGEKDVQQLAVAERMVVDLNLPVRIVPVPTVREPDGLALSTRNRRLTPEQRRAAPLLFQALMEVRRRIEEGERSSERVRQVALQILGEEPSIRVEYFEVVDPRAMQPVERISGEVRIASAAWLGTTRLIDNVSASPRGAEG